MRQLIELCQQLARFILSRHAAVFSPWRSPLTRGALAAPTMGHPDGAHTHGSGGNGLPEVVLVVLAVAVVATVVGH